MTVVPRRGSGPAALGLGVFAGLLAWSSRGVIGYWLRHPGRAELARLPGDVAPVLAAAAALTLVCWGLGRPLVRLAGADGDGLVSELTAYALGAGTVAGVLLALGLLGGLTAPVLLAAAAVAVAAAAAGLRGASRPVLRAPKNAEESVLAALAAFALGTGLIRSLAPVTDWDALAYHLPLARIYLETGRIREIPWMIEAQWPHASSLLYIPGMALAGGRAAAATQWFASVAFVAAAGGVAGRWLGRRAGLTACALTAVQPVVARFFGVPRAEVWWGLCLLLSQYWLWRPGGGRRRLVLAGALAGLAVSMKMFSVFDTGFLAAAALVLGRETPARRVRDAAVFLAAAGAVCAPWFVKAWVGAGNPVWPFGANWLGGLWHPAAIAPRFAAFGRWPPSTDAAFVLRDGPQYLLLPAAAALAAVPWPPILSAAAGVAVAHAASVSWTYEAWRYMTPVIPALAASAAWARERGSRGGAAARAAGAAVVVFGLLPAVTLSANNELFPVLELRSGRRPDLPPREAYLYAALPGYGYYRAADRALAAESGLGVKPRVLFFSEGLGGLLNADSMWGSPLYQNLVDYDSLPDAKALYRRLRALSVTDVSVDWASSDMSFYGRRATPLMRAMLARDAVAVVSDGPRTLYRLRR